MVRLFEETVTLTYSTWARSLVFILLTLNCSSRTTKCLKFLLVNRAVGRNFCFKTDCVNFVLLSISLNTRIR